MYRLIYTIILLFIFVSLVTDSEAKVLLNKDQALKIAFSDAQEIKEEQVFLTDKQVEEIKLYAKVPVESRLYVFYRGIKNNKTVSYALIDTHKLRTTTETLMFIINPDGSIKNIEIMAFYEPMDYMPTDRWIDLFNGKKLNNSLSIGKDIPNITGATITSNSLTTEVRKVLAVFKFGVRHDNDIREGEEN